MSDELSRNPENAHVKFRSAEAPRILVVDNDRNGGKFVYTVLSTAGYRTLLASSGPEALELAQMGELDLLITDLIMPNMTGPDLACAIGALIPGIKLLFTSGFTKAAALRFGFMPKAPFLEKPVSTVALRKMVAELLSPELAAERLSA